MKVVVVRDIPTLLQFCDEKFIFTWHTHTISSSPESNACFSSPCGFNSSYEVCTSTGSSFVCACPAGSLSDQMTGVCTGWFHMQHMPRTVRVINRQMRISTTDHYHHHTFMCSLLIIHTAYPCWLHASTCIKTAASLWCNCYQNESAV